MIPIIKKENDLLEWQRGLNTFIWDGKKPRVKLKILQDSRERGGLKAPNLRLYYEAAVLTHISEWLKSEQFGIMTLESYDLTYGWHAYMFEDGKVDKDFKSHILRSSLLRIWKKHRLNLDYKIPLWLNLGHIIKSLGGILYQQVLYTAEGRWYIRPLEDLLSQGLRLDWLQYNQLLSRWKEDQKTGFMQHEEDLVVQILDKGPKHIKRLYNILLERDSENELVKDCMIKWGQNFGESVMLETWEKIWVQNVKFTQSQNLRENFYKMFYRWHLDPKKLSCMYSNMQANCWRCDCTEATYFHIWWTCKKVKAFWIKIWWVMQNVLKKRLKFSPQLFLLGIVSGCTVIETKLILNMITAARLLIAQYWKKEVLPSIQDWISKVSGYAEMAKISAYLKNQMQENYVQEWSKWIEYIQNRFQMKTYHIAFT